MLLRTGEEATLIAATSPAIASSAPVTTTAIARPAGIPGTGRMMARGMIATEPAGMVAAVAWIATDISSAAVGRSASPAAARRSSHQHETDQCGGAGDHPNCRDRAHHDFSRFGSRCHDSTARDKKPCAHWYLRPNMGSRVH